MSSAPSSLGGGSNDFVKKLFQMLQADEYRDVVRWTHDGTSFVVLDTNEFTKDILPKHFKHGNFASFVRQLNKYDFHKVKTSNEERASYPYGEGSWEFKHSDFRRDDRDALEKIKRKPPNIRKVSANTAAVLGNDSAGGHAACEHILSQMSSNQTHLKEQVDRLVSENKTLCQQMNALESKYKTLVENIVNLNTINERSHSSLGILVNSLLQNGIKLPPLDFPVPSLSAIQVSSHMSNQSSHMSNQSSHNSQISAQINQHLNQHDFSNEQFMKPTPSTSDSKVSSNGTSPGMQNQASSEQQIKQDQQQQQQQESVMVPTNGLGEKRTWPPQKFHVLLVEDDNICIQLCQKFLKKYGCDVTVVHDGLSAISKVESNPYDLVLMDIIMPKLDGATATSVIRTFNTKTPIIAMTGNIEDNDLVNYLQNGMSDILAKPFSKDDLYNILSKHLLHGDDDSPQVKKPRS